MNKNTLRKLDVIFGFFLASVSVFFIIVSIKMPWDGISGGGIYAAPGLMPLIVAISIFFMSLSVAISAIKECGGIKREDVSHAIKSLKTIYTKRIFTMALIIVIYAFVLIGRIPFGIATFIYLCTFMILFRKDGKRWVCVVVSIVCAFLITFFFGNVINIPLP